jgi:hypothetical protein
VLQAIEKKEDVPGNGKAGGNIGNKIIGAEKLFAESQAKTIKQRRSMKQDECGIFTKR